MNLNWENIIQDFTYYNFEFQVEDDTSLAMEQKKIVMCEIDRSIERLIEKLAPNQLSR